MSSSALVEVDFDPFAAGSELELTTGSTEPQREVWTGARMGDDASCAFNESVSLHLDGELDVEAMRAAVGDLVARHESLRTTFSPDGTTLCVARELRVEVPLVDVGAEDAQRKEAERKKLITREVEEPFALERGPLLRVRLLRLSPREHVLTFTAHHIVVDGWSMAVCLRDLAALYSARRRGVAPALAPAPRFSEYAAAAAQRESTAEYAESERHWLQRFATPAPVLELPLDRPRPPAKTYAADRLDYVLDAALVEALKRMGGKLGASFFTTLLAGFEALLHRLTGSEELVVAIPAAGQSVTGKAELVGHCVNALPLRGAVTGDEPFSALVKRVRTTMLDAYEHQQYTFGTLLKKLPLARDPSRLPLVSVLFNVDRAVDGAELAFEGLRATFHSNPRHFENFELFVNAAETRGAVVLEVQYNTDLFDRATVQRWMKAYELLLRDAAASPEREVGALALLDDADREQLAAWNATARDYPREARVMDLLRAQAERTPHAVAAVAGSTKLTYRELHERARGLARHLRGLGVGPDVRVGLYVERGPEMLVALLGVLEAGGAYVPLDPAFPAERLSFMADDGGLRVLLTTSALEGSAPRAGRVVVLDRDAELAAAASDPLPPVGSSEDLAYVIYTSGSTGKPKGVEVPQRAVVNFLTSVAEQPGLRAGDVLLAVTTLSFDIAVLELLLPLSVGATVVLASREMAGDGAALLRAIAEHSVNVMQATPSTWRLLLAAGFTGSPDFVLLCGGEALPRDLAAELTRRGALWNMYGPTETTVWSTRQRLRAPIGRVVIGTPIANTQVHVLDARGQPVPVGVPGELYIGGDGVTRGYTGRPQLTGERFVADPFAGAGARMYRTGDLARWLPDGTLELLGRNDGQVKVRGYRIELGEIEARLAEHGCVDRAVVMVREDRAGDARLVAYVVSKGTAVSDEELRVHVSRALPSYMLPQHFVRLEALPLTPNGKIDRKQLPAPQAGTAEEGAFVAPRDDLERGLAALFAEVLGVPRIGVNDDFFQLGGHSLLAAQLMSRLSRERGVDLSLRRLFEAPTVARLADVVRGGPRGDDVRRAKIPRLDDPTVAPLSLMQQRIYFLEQLDPGKPVYNLPSCFRFKGKLELSVLTRALEAIVDRHATLRSSIVVRDGEAVQVVQPSVTLTIPYVDLRGLPLPSREPELMRLLQAEADRGFDLAVAPLVRGSVYQLADEETVLFWMPHHLVWDGWSFDVFLEELDALYGALLSGAPSPLPPLPIAYTEFASWQRRSVVGGGELERQSAYWKAQLGGPLPVLEMPTDKPRPSVMSFRGSTEPFVLPLAEVEPLERLGRESQATLYMVLLAAFKTLLLRYTQQEDVIVGTPIRGRAQPETENLIGFFVNTLALRTQLDPSASFRENLRRVRTTTLDAFSNQDMPFEQLVTERREAERDLSRTPIFQAFFTFQDVNNRGSSLGPVPYSQIHVHPKATPTDLSFWVKLTPNGIAGGLDYYTDVFEQATAVRFLKQLRTLLASIARDPDRAIGHLPILPESERRAILAVNDTAADYPRRATLGELVSAQCARTPESIALTFDGASISYAELDRRSSCLAHALREQGVENGVRVGLFLGRSSDLVVGLLGVSKAGGTYVPLDPAFPKERLAFMLEDARAALVLTHSSLRGEVPSPSAHVVLIDDPAHEHRSSEPLAADAKAATESTVAYVIYTSGSTGKPKGVQVPHRALANFLSAMQREPGLAATDTLLAVTTLSFDIAVLELLLPLTVGARVVIAPREVVSDGEQLVKLIEREAVTVMQATPSTWRLVLASGFGERPAFRALVGGEALPTDLAEQLVSRVGGLWNMYGPTETTVWSTRYRVPRERPREVRIGRPIANTQIYVLDPRRELMPFGAVGELYIGGDGVSLGYLHRPELTSERFVADPFAERPSARLYRTGDLVRLHPDGELEYVRRDDTQVKVRGYRIELGEIESALVTHAAVRQAVVVVREDRPGDARLVAYTVRRPGEEYTDTELRKHLRRSLPDYMLPQHFVELEDLPLTANGKVDRKRLPAPFAAPAAGEEHVAPRTPTEQRLAQLWIEALKVGRVGLHDNFFDLGGHSLLCLSMIARVEQETGVRLSPRVILRDSLEQVAAQLDAARPSAPPAEIAKSKEDASLARRVLGKLLGR